MTQTTTHTPGPWEIMQCLPRVPDYPGQTETVIVDSDNRNVLNRDLFEEAANALLIAAAPDLLEACQALVDASFSNDPMLLSRAVDLARAAIAKAKGV